MDKIITSVLATACFIAFTAGLANSIGETPFIIIVGIVILMLLIDVYSEIKAGDQNGHNDEG